MPRPIPILRVVANPFLVLDEDGRPSATVALDPDHHSPDRRRIGSILHADPVEIRSPVNAKNVTGDNRYSIHDHWFEHTAEPETVPDTPYYRQRLREGTILPANAETSKKLGVKHVDPSAVILETAKQAAKVWAREHDDETPQWASNVAVDDMHPSHATHAKLVAAHAAKIPATFTGGVKLPTLIPKPAEGASK